MASSDRAARRKTTGIQQLCQSVRSLQGEKSVGENPDTEVSYTSWDDQEFSVVSREVNFLSGIPSGIKVACWITPELSNLPNCCAHPLKESGTQWHGMGCCLSFFPFSLQYDGTFSEFKFSASSASSTRLGRWRSSLW